VTLPEPEPEVVILVEQGRKIQAIKRYRELNPGTGLKEAKDVIDGLAGQVLSGGGVSTWGSSLSGHPEHHWPQRHQRRRPGP
jgi:Ribosomal protein L7/L12 C-terminal domain